MTAKNTLKGGAIALGVLLLAGAAIAVASVWRGESDEGLGHAMPCGSDGSMTGGHTSGNHSRRNRTHEGQAGHSSGDASCMMGDHGQ